LGDAIIPNPGEVLLSYVDHRTSPDVHGPAASHWGLPENYEIRFLQALSEIDRLTERELEVFALLGLGLANRMIAKTLGVTERTVKAHVCQIFVKLGMDGRAEVAVVSFIWRSGMTQSSTSPVAEGGTTTSALSRRLWPRREHRP
jgi:DNA-binding CsgD family transcriptional regulator